MRGGIDTQHPLPGLADRMLDAQHAFRLTLEAMSHPGRAVHIPLALQAPAPLAAASAAFILSMLDHETPLWLQQPNDRVRDYLRFHCSVTLVDKPGSARYALVTDAAVMPEFDAFAPDDAQHPGRSATLIVQVPRLIGGRRVRLSGPGVLAPVAIDPSGLRPDFWLQWQRNCAQFPLGVDLILVCGASLLALPRTIAVEF